MKGSATAHKVQASSRHVYFTLVDHKCQGQTAESRNVGYVERQNCYTSAVVELMSNIGLVPAFAVALPPISNMSTLLPKTDILC